MRRRVVLIGLVAVLFGACAGLALLAATLRPDGLKARIAAAVRDATGRELTLAGPLHLSWSLIPTLVAEDVRFANPPGLSRPDMLTAARIEARVALLPLLSRRVEVRRVLLVRPDLVLEADAAGRPNWRFDQPPAAPAPSAAPPGASRAGFAVSLQQLRVEAGQVGYRPAVGEPVRAGIPSLTAEATAVDAPLAVAGAVTLRDAPFAIRGSTGSVLALAAGAAPWPVRLEAEGGGLALRAEGTLGAGGALTIEARASDLAQLSPLAGRALPALRNVEATARLAGGALTGAALRAGGVQFAPGVRLEALTLDAPEPSAPVALSGALTLGGVPVRLAGTVGTLSALLAGGPLPADLRADAGDGAIVSLRGTLAEPRVGRGFDALVSARIPNLAALGPASGNRLPALTDLALDARLTDPAAGLASGVTVGALRLSSSVGDLSGDLAAAWAPRPSLRGALLSRRLDLAAIQVALRRLPPSALPPPVQPKAGSTTAAVAPRIRLFPDEALPFAALRAADADLRLSLAEVVLPGAAIFRDVEARLVLEGGTLRLDPFSASAPGGPVEGVLLLDAAGASDPTAALRLRSPGLALGPLLAAFGWSGDGSGSLELDLDLRGVGRSPHALASTLTGHFGAALVNGELDGEVLSAAFSEALRRANLPVELGGRVAVRCLALRAEAASGAVTLPALLIDTARLRVEGGGTADLGAETLDLRLRPAARLGGAGVELPLRIGGTLLDPRAALDAGPSGRVGATIDAGAPPPADACEAQLALARGGAAGTLPTAAAPETARPVNPVDLLRSLLRRP